MAQRTLAFSRTKFRLARTGPGAADGGFQPSVHRHLPVQDGYTVALAIAGGRFHQKGSGAAELIGHPKTTNVVLWSGMSYVDFMPRLSIDITPEEHQKLKAIAALKGESIKDYVLKCTLGDAPALNEVSEDDAVAALADFLKPRIEQARRREFSTKSMADIRREAHKQAGL